jgi:phosphoribosylaminoimidazole (AIR) synthetase
MIDLVRASKHLTDLDISGTSLGVRKIGQVMRSISGNQDNTDMPISISGLYRNGFGQISTRQVEQD